MASPAAYGRYAAGLGQEAKARSRRGRVLRPARRSSLCRALRHTASVVRPTPFDPATGRRVITLAMTSCTAVVMGGQIARLLAERAPHVVLRLRTVLRWNPTPPAAAMRWGMSRVSETGELEDDVGERLQQLRHWSPR